jgi:hypothetical protein
VVEDLPHVGPDASGLNLFLSGIFAGCSGDGESLLGSIHVADAQSGEIWQRAMTTAMAIAVFVALRSRHDENCEPNAH